MQKEIFISVDLETDGAIPGDFSMLSIGACVVDHESKNFYCELKPISEKFEPEAMAVNSLDRERLLKEGMEAREALLKFETWIQEVAAEAQPVFIGFNAPFDWMFSHWYFIHFLGRDPFGHSALDTKAYYLGRANLELWSDTSKSKLPKEFLPEGRFTHNALDDAKYQAEVFRRMRDKNKEDR